MKKLKITVFSFTLITIILFFNYSTPKALAVTLKIPEIKGVIKGPDNYDLSKYHLELEWYCNEPAFLKDAGERCGGIGKKSGNQIVEIDKEGRFYIRSVRVTRLFNNATFYLRFGFFHNKFRGVENRLFKKQYQTGKGYNVTKLLKKDLSNLRVIRVIGGKFTVKVMAKDIDNEIMPFNRLWNKRPLSRLFESNVCLWIYRFKKPSNSELSNIICFKIIDNKVLIPNFEFLQLGSEIPYFDFMQSDLNNKIPFKVELENEISIVKKNGTESYDKDTFSKILIMNVNDKLEANLPHEFTNYLRSINILIDINKKGRSY